MKLTIFQAADGDCLLLTGKDGKNLLVDGGRTGAFRENVAPDLGALAEAGGVLDLVCVSHIDGDHIEGILELMDEILGWKVYDYQQSRGNARFPKPDLPRPPQVLGIWHNSFKDVIGENSGAIQSQLVANASTMLAVPDFAGYAPINENLANSIEDSLRLASRVGPKELRIPVNAPSGGKTLLAPDSPCIYPLGGINLYLLAPFASDLERLRRKWNQWLNNNQKTVQKVREDARKDEEQLPMMSEGQRVMTAVRDLATALGKRSLVTPPNLASIMLLAEEGDRTILLTGDGHARDILKGLQVQGKLDAQGRIHVNVLKVQHHGAEYNITEDFCDRVTADHYIFCANGASKNPDLEVLQVLVTRRNRAGTPYKLWFNSSVRLASGGIENQNHMQKVEDLVRSLAKKSRGRMTYEFLQSGNKMVMEV